MDILQFKNELYIQNKVHQVFDLFCLYLKVLSGYLSSTRTDREGLFVW